jgi:hypothetical protein
MLQAPESWARPEQPAVLVEVEHDNMSNQVEGQLLSFISPHLAMASNEHEMLGVWQLAVATMRHNNVPGF